MNALEDHIYGFKIAFEKIFQGNYWGYLIPSFIISIMFIIVAGFVSLFFNFFNGVNGIPFVGDYLDVGISSTKSFFSYVGDVFYQFFILTALSPVYCLLSEKVDNDLTGEKFDGGLVRIMTDLIRTIFIVIVSIILYLISVGIWAFIAAITDFHVLDEIIYFCIGAFYIGFSFYDYSLERYGVPTFGSWSFGFNKIPYMFLTGCAFSLIFKVPYLGVIFAPFLVTIVSTVVFLKIHDKIEVKTL